MDRKRIEYLKQQHAFDQWRDANTLDENLFVWKFFLAGTEIPEWKPQRIQKLEAPPPQTPSTPSMSIATEATTKPSTRVVRSLWQRPRAQAEAVQSVQDLKLPASPESMPGREEWPDQNWRPRCIQSIWRMPEKHPNALLSVNIFECPSRAIGHEFLLILLAEFESPLITRREDSSIGDVVFSGPQDSMLLFARANLVYLVRNADREVIPVSSIAGELDNDLLSKPAEIQEERRAERTSRKRAAAESQPESIKAKVGSSMPIDMASLTLPLRSGATARMMTTEAVEEPVTELQVMYKVFSGLKCEVYDENGQVMYRPQKAGQEKIDIYVVDSNRNVASTTLRVVASK